MPILSEGDATYCQDNNRVGNRIDRARVRAEPFYFAGMSKNKTGCVRQAKNQRHQYDAAYFGFESGSEL